MLCRLRAAAQSSLNAACGLVLQQSRIHGFGLVGYCVILLLSMTSGCADKPWSQADLGRPPAPPPAVIVRDPDRRSLAGGRAAPTDNQAVRAAAAAELGEQTANEIRGTTRAAAPPMPIEPAAQALVESMLNSMRDRAIGQDGFTRVGTSQLRNQSRTSSAEFDAFRQRLADILSSAGKQWRLQFVADDAPTGDNQYELQGAAYLVTVQGFDVWEVFLSVSAKPALLTIWNGSGQPLRILRTPLAGQPQILP
jgi:hypothetical protein